MRFAIVGCGLIGKKRAEALPLGLLSICCDLNLEKAKNLALNRPGCKVTTRFEDVLESDADAIIIATTNQNLSRLTLAAVEAGKHVMVEKPAGISSSELELIDKLARKKALCVRVGFNHRFHPAILKAQEILLSGSVGPLMFVRGRYGHGGRLGYDTEWRADPAQSGGGELIDQGVHLIDLASMFLGPLHLLHGQSYTYFWNMPVDDNAFLHLQTIHNQSAWLHVSCTEWKNLFSLEIYGRTAKLHIEGLGGSYGVERLYHYQMTPEMGPPQTQIYEYPRGDESWRIETELFVDDLKHQRQSHPGLPEAIASLKIVEDIYKNGIRRQV